MDVQTFKQEIAAALRSYDRHVVCLEKDTETCEASLYSLVEKAIRALTTAVHALPKEEQARIAADSAAKWQQFRAAFDTSGLCKKHRGIIAGLARNRNAIALPAEYDHFLGLFTA